MSESLSPVWRGLVDDAAIFPPGNADLAAALAAFRSRREEEYADLVASFVVTDERLGQAVGADDEGSAVPLSVVLTTGAGAVAGVAAKARRAGVPLAGVEVSLRDVDDLAGNARRVVAAVEEARAAGDLDEEVPVHVELPQADPTAGWLAAADEVAARCEEGFRLKFRLGGVDPAMVPAPATVAAWLDAALDRETPFKCTAGLHRAVRHTATGESGPVDQHGFLNVLLATRHAFDGAPTDAVVATLEERDAAVLVDAARALGASLPGTRRWFTSFGSCSVAEPWQDLVDLDLVRVGA